VAVAAAATATAADDSSLVRCRLSQSLSHSLRLFSAASVVLVSSVGLSYVVEEKRRRNDNECFPDDVTVFIIV
jgi:hypothetical protein